MESLLQMVELAMWKHFVVSGLRNINRNRFVSIIIILGFALSISIILPVLFLTVEHSKYDRYHKSDQIFRIKTTINNQFEFAKSPPLINTYLYSSYRHSFSRVHFVYPHNTKVVLDRGYLSVKTAFVDSVFFKTFNFESAVLRSLSALSPSDIIISNKTAQIIFGKKDAIGRQIELSDLGIFTVVGIIDKGAVKTHLDFDIYLSSVFLQAMVGRGEIEDVFSSFTSYSGGYNYVVLNTNSDKHALEEALRDLSRTGARQISEHFKTKIDVQFDLQPVTEIITNKLIGDTDLVRSQPTTTLLLIIGFILFVIAVINYVNLLVNKYLDRSKEIGIKKTVGASRSHLFIQFTIESVFISLFAFLLGYGLMFLVPVREVENILNTKFDFTVVLYSILLSIVIGILAAVVPSAILVNTKAINAMKANSGSAFGKGWRLKRILLLIQFTASIVVLICLHTFNKQTKFMMTVDHGFQMTNLGILELQQVNFELLNNALDEIPEVQNVSFVSNNFGSMPEAVEIRRDFESKSINCFQYSASPKFVATFGLELLATNDLIHSNSSGEYVLINEEGVHWLGFNSLDHAIGATILIQDSIKATIGGVLKNFYFDNFKRPIYPLIVRTIPSEYKFVIIEFFNKEDIGLSREKLQDTWEKLFPDYPFEFQPYSDMLETKMSYKKDFMLLLTITYYALFMTLLGLLGLIINHMNLRLKEISINKVMGAGRLDLIWLLGRDFFILIAISGVIGSPIGYFLASSMLDEFVYKFEMGFFVLLPPVLLISFVAVGQIVIYSYFMTKVNPIKYLRYE